MKRRILIIGASGQIGTELTSFLRQQYGPDQVIASDIRKSAIIPEVDGPFEVLDATDKEALLALLIKHDIGHVYLMAAMLSATGELHPMKAWDLNMSTLFNVLNLAKDGYIDRIFWPSSIAVFGPTTPREQTPQHTIMEPSTVYGISKQTGERWCAYYFAKYGVDVRSLRYPGLISYKTPPGGGTTDYAIDIYHKALNEGTYSCFLSAETTLPMMYMDDAIRATITLMEAPSDQVKIRSSYNLAGMSFDPVAIAASIQKHLPDFTMTYAPDFRQAIADSWPKSIDDSHAQNDWGWAAQFDLETTTKVMLASLKSQY
ncbi:MAG: NAD-dependent epimerase/dehydratase family protein [Flavobacteriaceae bacterium]|jgi:nucleoside-diphosphate-sugar epimerase|nr:NAD-dependent epimerase/dehydratase family protein [Flavobacteriaceae bacterium]MDG1961582.1 NAD-dependent epimerase/dehydratase family protein [Flavobacteriaceae bacterium]